jgi:hypothetical protein
MREPRGPLNTAPRLIDDGIDAAADIEQALHDIENHERLADLHRSKARRLRKAMAVQVVVVAEALAGLHRRRQQARAARTARAGGVYTGPDRRRSERRAPLGRAA